MLAVSAKRHRQASLQRGAMGELGVVVGVTELVRGRLRRVDAAAPVEEDQRAVVDERHAERPAALAGARPGIDPLLVDRAVDEAAEALAVRGERLRTMPRPSVHEIELGANGSGANRSYHGKRPGASVQPGLGTHPAAEVGKRLRRPQPASRRTSPG